MSDDEFQDDHVDFDDAGEGGEGFEDFEGGGATLGDMWRNNPLVKIGVIAGGLITIIGAIILFGGGPDRTLVSQTGGGRFVKGTPGEEGVSEAMKQAIREKNEERVDAALKDKGSALPTPIESPVSRLQIPEEQAVGEDPLERWRRIQEERQRQTSQRAPEEAVTNPHADAIDALAAAMAAQMEGILEAQDPLEPVHIGVTDQEFLNQLRQNLEEERKEALEKLAQTQGDDEQIVNILLPAGTIEYGQLVLEANSDIDDGPVLAYLASGPLAGAKILGGFEVKKEHLVLTFDTIVIDGIAHKTDAIALDPDTTLPALATDVDQRYFSRVILPAAAAFVEGMGEAIAGTNQTNVTVEGGAAVSSEEELDTREEIFKGIEKASEVVGEILEENADEVKPLIRVRAGTPMGILFLDAVTDETS